MGYIPDTQVATTGCVRFRRQTAASERPYVREVTEAPAPCPCESTEREQDAVFGLDALAGLEVVKVLRRLLKI